MRLLNKKECDKLVELGILEETETISGQKAFSNIFNKGVFPLNESMMGQKPTCAPSICIYPWMIKKNWKNTEIFSISKPTKSLKGRILNKKECDKLVELGILEIHPILLDGYKHFNCKDIINNNYMLGKKVNCVDSSFKIWPWMLKKNWKKTWIFN